MQPFRLNNNQTLVATPVNSQTGLLANNNPNFVALNNYNADEVLSARLNNGYYMGLFVKTNNGQGQSDTFHSAKIVNGQLYILNPQDPGYGAFREEFINGNVGIVKFAGLNSQYNNGGQYNNGQYNQQGSRYQSRQQTPSGFNSNEEIVLIKMRSDGGFVDKGNPHLYAYGFDFNGASQKILKSQLPAGQEWGAFIRKKAPHGVQDVFEKLIINESGQFIRPNLGDPSFQAYTETTTGMPLARIDVSGLNMANRQHFQNQNNQVPGHNYNNNGF